MIELCTPMYETGIPKRAKANQRIRKALKESGFCQWELALFLGMGETTLSRYLRQELPEEEQDKIIDLIRKHTVEEG